ncbi:MAG: carboxypeptidase-like regulatory domain-containing protein [Bacteroidales bacterium]|jgi:hypothetical protein
MTAKQERKLNMFMAVRDYLTGHEAALKDLPGYADNYRILQESINKIQTAAENQKSNKTGLYKEKTRIKKELTDLAADFSRKITAFATFSGNQALASEVYYTSSSLRKGSEVALKDHAQIIHDRVEANIDSLISYGITPEALQTFATLIAAFNTALTRPRIGITEKRLATSQLAEYFPEGENAINNLDLSLGIIALSKPDIFTGYKTARILVDAGSRVFALKAIVTETGTGYPVRNATFTFCLNGRNAGTVVLTKKTSEKGIFYVRNMAPGTYNVNIFKAGYVTKNVTVNLTAGERTDMKIVLEKE